MTDSIQKIPNKELTFGKKLGEGGFGIVYKGSWSGEDVAIKTLRMTKLPSVLQEEFTREATSMARLNNPRVIHLFGICTEPGHYAMVMAFMPKRDLYELLSEPKRQLPWSKRWKLAIDISIGLSYLHKNHIIHRDLKSLNILLDQNERAKITDFGLAKLRQQTKSIYTDKVKGSIPWMAPELFGRRAKVSDKSDVYAYGMVLWELASRKTPFSDAHDPNIIPMWIMQGEREDIPKECPKPFSQVIERCWKGKPEERPTAAMALDQLLKEQPKQQEAPLHNNNSSTDNNLPMPKGTKTEFSFGSKETLKGLTSNQDKSSLKPTFDNWQCLHTLKGHKDWVRALASLGSDLFASGSSDATIKIWNTSGQCLHTLKGHKDGVRALASLGGDLFASGSEDKTIKIWNTLGKRLRTLKGHESGVNALASLGGDLFASGSSDRTIKIWNTSGKCLRTLKGHSNYVFVLASLGGDLFASASDDKTIKIWEAKK